VSNSCNSATNLFGWHSNSKKHKKKRIAVAACSVISYDFGFKKVIGCQTLERWLKKIDNVVRNRNARLALNINHKCRPGTSYTDWIARAHPIYLHEMYRQATSLLGDDATFEETAAMMNLQSTGLEGLPTLP
jgi:hypothetical protein